VDDLVIEAPNLLSSTQSFGADGNGPEDTGENYCSGGAFKKAFE